MSDHKPEERPQDLDDSLMWSGTEIRPFPLMCGLSGLGSRAKRLVSVKVSIQESRTLAP